jgi:hypothetical protein
MRTDTLERVAALDFKSPFDELTELRESMTTQEIAGLTGLRRETVSRARPDSRFRRRTEKAIGDLYAVVTRMKAVAGEDLVRPGAILRRPQAIFAGRSIAELLKEGEVDAVLQHLAAPEAAELADPPRPGEPPKGAVDAFLAANPDLAALLPEIEVKLREHFAPVDRIERGVTVEHEGEADDVLYLWAHNDLSLDENEKRFMALLEREREFLRPVRSRLNIGFL